MPYTPSGPFITGGNWFQYLQFAAKYPGLHNRGNDRWFVFMVATSEAAGDLRVWHSADAGLTWVSEDQLAMPELALFQVGTARFDNDTMRICYGGSPPETMGLGIPAVRDFDLVTNTLGPLLYNADAFVMDTPQLAGYTRNPVAGEDWIFCRVTALFPFTGNQLYLYRHDGGAFLPTVFVSDNVAAPTTKLVAMEQVYVDSAGTAHVLYSERPRVGPQKPRIVYYRQIDVTGAMTAPVVVYTYNFISYQAFGFPAAVGSTLVFPFPLENGSSEADQHWTGAMLVVDPYLAAAPSITQIPLPTERLNLETTAPSGSVHAASLGGQIYLWWVEEQSLDGMSPLSRIMYTPWSGGAIPAGTIWHDDLANPSFGIGGPMANLGQPIMDVADPMLLVGMVGGYVYWFSVAGPPGAPAVLPAAGSRRMVILVPNRWDHCLRALRVAEQELVARRACCEQETWVDVDGVRAPKNFIPFRKTGAIPTPLAVSGDVEIFNFRVPTGYDGLIAALFHDYTGPGFADGNGDILWRLLVNRTYAIHLGDVLVRLGSRQQSYGLDGGIHIQSGQIVRYIVNVPNLSGGILPLATQIVAGLEGLFYARR